MARFLTLLALLYFTPSLFAQRAEVFALEIGRAKYASFSKIGTHLFIWVDTPETMVALDPASPITLQAAPSNIDLIAVAEQRKRDYDEETNRLALQGRMRFDTRMQKAVTYSSSPARDTSGFTFEIDLVSPPPAGTRTLHLGGTLTYTVATTDTVSLTFPVENLYTTAEDRQPVTVENVSVHFARTGATYYGDQQEYRVSLADHDPVAFVINGEEQPGLTVPEATAREPIELTIKAVKTETRQLPLDLEVTLGL
ncbi:hypothetical protein [Lewinella sp. IMCC34191]|uniref:hypothetical protein n=1 Tax=Lewinella sp. IMCC34191 TaxID=2259172 RepID=UPI000E267F99|nr:hypothetical protein [Lewinella sp. IMCC34191]